jgi:hypothetical protein
MQQRLLRNTGKTGHGRGATVPRVPCLFGGANAHPFALFRMSCALGWLSVVAAAAAPAQTFTTLVNFDGSNGAGPSYGSLVQGITGISTGPLSAAGPRARERFS